MKSIASLFGIGVWVAGWIIAQGFWSTFFAVVFPLWGWYLVIEKLLVHYGVL